MELAYPSVQKIPWNRSGTPFEALPTRQHHPCEFPKIDRQELDGPGLAAGAVCSGGLPVGRPITEPMKALDASNDLTVEYGVLLTCARVRM